MGTQNRKDGSGREKSVDVQGTPWMKGRDPLEGKGASSGDGRLETGGGGGGAERLNGDSMTRELIYRETSPGRADVGQRGPEL